MARWARGGGHRPVGTRSVTQSLVPRGPQGALGPDFQGLCPDSSLYQNIPPSHNGARRGSGSGGSVPPSLSRACLPDGCLL